MVVLWGVFMFVVPNRRRNVFTLLCFMYVVSMVLTSGQIYLIYLVPIGQCSPPSV